IDADEIDWISAYDYYAVLHVGSRRYLLRESLAALEGRLPHEVFIRVHRSAIVNCTKVRELNRDTVVLHDGTRVKTSRRRRSAVNAALREAATR
ncbi:MAG TPA: LytTR family DNA-binding domain-containing protein, partial [Gemmatimonadaceae bacterium]